MDSHSKHYLSRRSDSSRLVSYLLQFSLVVAWRAVSTISAPVTRVFSFYVASWRALGRLVAWSQRVLCKLLAWLASPAFDKGARHWEGYRRWHVVLGKGEEGHGLAKGVLAWRAHNTFFPCHAGALVAAQLVRSVIKRLQEAWDKRLRAIRVARDRQQAAGSYQEWRQWSEQLAKLEQLSGEAKKRDWQYDRKLLAQKVAHLRRVRESGNPRDMMFALRTDLIRNVANIAKT